MRNEKKMEPVVLHPIGVVRTDCKKLPRHWTCSDVEGELVIDERYEQGLCDIKEGDRIVVLFHFHKSPPFSPEMLRQTPPHRNRKLGVFSICSPRRPNPLGLSVLRVLQVNGCTLLVKGLDMIDGTPILDIKPFVTAPEHCPSSVRHVER